MRYHNSLQACVELCYPRHCCTEVGHFLTFYFSFITFNYLETASKTLVSSPQPLPLHPDLPRSTPHRLALRYLVNKEEEEKEEMIVKAVSTPVPGSYGEAFTTVQES